MLTLTDPNGATLYPKLWNRYASTRETRDIVHELASGDLEITLRRPTTRACVVRLLFADETEALVCELLHRDLTGAMTVSDPEVPSVGMSYTRAPGGSIRREQVEGYEVWFVEIDALELGWPTLNQAAPWTLLYNNRFERNPGMRTTLGNTFHSAPGNDASSTLSYGVASPAFGSGFAGALTVAGTPSGRVIVGPSPANLNIPYAAYPTSDLTLSWTIYNAGTVAYEVDTSHANLLGDVKAVSEPTTVAPGQTAKQYLTIRPSAPQESNARAWSRVLMPAGQLHIGDYDIYPGAYQPDRPGFDGSAPPLSAMHRTRWMGEVGNSISRMDIRKAA